MIITQSINSAGIELPVPYQIMFEDHIQSRLEPYALEKIISKTHPVITQPTVMIKPKPIVSASQVHLMCMALAKTLQAPVAPDTKDVDISPNTTPTMQTSDTFTSQADIVRIKGQEINDKE